MKRATLPLALPLAAAAWLAGAAAFAVVVDDFSTAQATLTDPPGGASTAVTGGADILGQRRGLMVDLVTGAGPASVGVAAGALSFGVSDTTPDSRGRVELSWDGDLDPLTLSPTGLGGVDLGAGGHRAFRLTIDQASAGVVVVLTVYSDATHASRAARLLPAIAVPTAVLVEFAELAALPGMAGPADLAAAGAVVMEVAGTEATLVLTAFDTVPPAVAALKADFVGGDPTAGPVAPGGQFTYRVTITNTGGTATSVALADVLDPNLALVGAVRTVPVVRDDAYRTITGTVLDSSAAGLPALVDNDADPDGDPLLAVASTGLATAQGGSVDIAADGHFVYTPPAGFNGVDAFDYALQATPGDPTEDANDAAIGPISATARIFVDSVPPTVTAGGTLAYVENDPPTAIDATITVADADSPNLVGATAQITANYQSGEDLLAFVDTPAITAVFVPATGTLTLSGTDTVANYQTALRAVTYENGSDAPSTAARTVTWIVDDGGNTSAPATSTITVTSVNDPPVLTAGGLLAYTENQAATPIDTTITVADADHANLASATAQITTSYQNGQDVLGCPAPCGGLSAVFVPGTGTLTLSGSAPLATYQSVLRGVTYVNTSENPSALTRTVTWIGSDGVDASAPVTSTITVTPVNDPPVAADDAWDTIGNTQLVVDLPALATPHVRDTTASTFGVRDNDTDPAEGNNHAVSAIVGCADVTPPFGDAPPCATANGGRVVLEANGRFTYTPAAGDVAAADSFQYTLTDDGLPVPASDNATVTISRFERVWYVDNDSAAGGLGRSGDPFDTLVEAQAASSPNDWLFVHFGDGTTTGQNAGIALKNGQHLFGEHAGLAIAVNLNGNGSPAVLFPAAPGNRPLLDDTVVGVPEGVAATDAIPVEIVGLSLAGNVNAVDWTTTAPFAGGGALSIRENVVRGAGGEGIDVNLAGSGATQLAFHDNSLSATGTALDVQETGAGTLTVTAFHDNVVAPTSAGAGILAVNAIFDAVPGGAVDPVPGGTTVIGTPGDRIGGPGLTLTGTAGALNFANVPAGSIGVGDLDIFTDSGAALSASGVGVFDLDVTPDTGVLVANAGPAAVLATLDANLQWNSLTSANSATGGVSLTGVTGTFSAPSGSSITNATGTDFLVSGGNANVTYGGTITDDLGQLVSVASTTGGIKAFTGAITDGGDGDGSGISLANNTGATIRFSGGLVLSTGANSAFAATGGGTVEICDENPCSPGATGGLVNTLATTTGTALNVTNTTIGANHLELRSVASNGGSGNGIVLSSTGPTGGLKVKGTGTAGSGGTIANKSGADGSTTQGSGIFLSNTAGVSLSRMQLNDFQNFAIRGVNVSGFDLADCVVSGTNGTNEASPFNEGSIRFDELTGTVSISGGDVSGGRQRNVWIDNTTGTLGLTVTGANIHDTGTIVGDDGLGVEIGGGNATIAVTNNTFSAHGGDHFNLSLLGSPTVDLTFTGNLWSGGHVIGLGQGLFVLGATFNGSLTYDISNNGTVGQPLVGNRQGGAMHVNKGSGTGTFSGTISNNVIGDPAVNGSGSSEGSGIDVESHGAGGSHTTLISNNLVRQFHNDGILVLAGEGNAAFNATVTGNTVSNPDATLASLHGMHFNIGTLPTDALQACLEVANNALTNGGNEPNGGVDLRMRQRQLTTVRLPGYGGANNDNAAVQTFLTTTKANAVTTILVSNSVATGGGGFVGGAACPLP